VAALVAVGVVVLTGDDEPARLDTADAVRAIDDLDDQLADDREAARAASTGFVVSLATCPFGDLADLREPATGDPGELDTDGDPTQFAGTFEDDDSEPIVYQCVDDVALDEGDPGSSRRFVAVLVGRASTKTGHRRYVRSTTDGFSVDFGDDEDHRGGQIITYCATPRDDTNDDLASFCEADWVNDDVQVGVFATVGEEQLPNLRDWLVSVLDDVVAGVIANDGELERAG
jgi:hypothetical protein